VSEPVRVHALHVAPGRRLPTKSVTSVEAEAGKGLVGDRYHGTRHRHVTVQSLTALAEGAARLGAPIDPGATRRNLTLTSGEVPTTPGARLRIGEVLLEVVRVAAPCRLLDDWIGRGAMEALRRRGGSVCRVLESGTITVGDVVEVQADPVGENPVPPDLRVRRLRERQVTDREALHALLDEALVAHVGIVRDGRPVVLPLACARDGDHLLLHGSTGGGLLAAAAAGAEVAATVTELDGVVYARSVFDSSMNYRSAMVRGVPEVLEGAAKLAGLRTITEHLMPGRWSEARVPNAKELAATLLLRLPLTHTSMKRRTGPASAAPDDGEDRSIWAGVLPLGTVASAPVPSPDNAPDAPLPASVAERRG
jgi:nitroimidazol reductase NimA-like FMN-containing flavoprotein (pyridoxamine 5'-phosphate oxidase superfamily)